MKNFLLSLFCLFVIFSFGCGQKPLDQETQLLMGTLVEVVSENEQAGNIAFRELKRIEGLLSKYKEESEISQLNKSGKLNVSPETLYVIKQAKKFWAATDGAFDITVGPLMDAWGFTDKDCQLPDKLKIKKALELVGFDKLIIDERNLRIEFKLPGMKIDLGAIAKGYAVDCAIKKLKERGIKSCLINAGGDIYCLGDKSGRPWRVAIQNPRGYRPTGYLKLKDKAVATSGDYEQFFINGHKRYSHILNPHTGYPADSGVVSATVIAPNCLTADAIATSIFVLGKEKGLKLAEKFSGVAAEIVEGRDASDNQ